MSNPLLKLVSVACPVPISRLPVGSVTSSHQLSCVQQLLPLLWDLQGLLDNFIRVKRGLRVGWVQGGANSWAGLRWLRVGYISGPGQGWQ